MSVQPQLLQMALEPGDVVYTPSAIALDMVEYFEPKGSILEPSAGDGIFLRYLPPETEWCEIEKGRDFFTYQKRVDWIIGNPPYSIFSEFLAHSFRLAENVVYILPTNKIFQSWRIMNQIEKYGGIRAMLVYGGGNAVGFPFGFSVGAFHFQRGWKGDSTIVFRNLSNNRKSPCLDKKSQ